MNDIRFAHAHGIKTLYYANPYVDKLEEDEVELPEEKQDEEECESCVL